MWGIYSETVAVQQKWRELDLKLCRGGGKKVVDKETKEAGSRAW